MPLRHTSILILLSLTSCLLPSHAQSITTLLATIEQNNLQLRAARETKAAEAADREALNVLGPTSVEYSPFFHARYPGIVSSELIATQEFDYPTLYAQRRESARLQQHLGELEYRTLRRDILLEAAECCNGLIAARDNANLINRRLAAADSLLAIVEKRLDYGHATIIDLNRIRMDRMSLTAEAAESATTTLRLCQQLQRLNGDQPLSLTIDELTPITDAADIGTTTSCVTPDEPLEVLTAEAALSATRHELQMSRKSWLPTFTAGFRINTEQRDANGGFVVGVSFPLFGNAKKQKAARLHHSAAQLQLADAQAEAENRQRRLAAQAESLRRTLAAYDQSLMEETLQHLLHAVLSGEVTIAEYYTESQRVVALMQQRLSTESEYNNILLQIIRERL